MAEDQGLFLQQNAADTLLRNTSSLQVLLNMGFTKQRALKALSATGDAGVQVACDWIFAHINDPMLDAADAREFILYACPTGPFGSQLDDFWEESQAACGRNGVHSSFPHVTLCSFFKKIVWFLGQPPQCPTCVVSTAAVPTRVVFTAHGGVFLNMNVKQKIVQAMCEDEKVSQLMQGMEEACERALKEACPAKFEVEYFSSDNYVGLFLEDKAARFLRNLSDVFAEEVQKSTGAKVESHKNKQLHITLAYKFPSTQLKPLEKLAKRLDLHKPSTWEVRLYSKDPRYTNCETLRVLYPYAPTSDGHLQLINGDYVFVGPDDVSDKSGFDGWFYGTSWLTGCSGFFPASHTERSADTNTWTVHKASTLSKTSGTGTRRKLTRRYSRGADEFHSTGYTSSHGLLQTDIGAVPENSATNHSLPRPPTTSNDGKEPPPRPPKDDIYSQIQKPKGVLPVPTKLSQKSRRIYIFRHAERVDVTFGKQWFNLSFDDAGRYHRKNLNMPKKLPKRPGGASDFKQDGPITEMGQHQAFLTGQALKHIGVEVSHVFSSPSLRCLQTATAILQGMELDRKLEINIDLSLYEWMKWSPGGLPRFMERANLAEFGINVSSGYQALTAPEALPGNERCVDYFKRCHKFITHVINNTSGDILVAAHAGSLDGLSRQLQGLSPRPMPQFVGIVTKIPYCGSVVLEDYTDEIGVWQLIEPPYPTLIHAPNPHFDWKTLNE